MPLSGGTAGAHDDSSHQGSSKRDVAGGVAGLDTGGDLLAQGPDLHLVRDGANNIELMERTSGEIVARFTRIGVDDYEFRTHCGAVACIVQNDSMKDVVNGIAGLDSLGNLLIVGYQIYLARDGSDNIVIRERTSGENTTYWNRLGVNDYVQYILESAGYSRVLTESLKDAANGIAGLDASALIPLSLMDNLILTEVKFRTNPGTGTATNPSLLNNNNPVVHVDFDAVNEYVEVDFGCKRLVTWWRMYGHIVIGHTDDGRFKIQHNIDGTWYDNQIDINVVWANAWGSWTPIAGPVFTDKIRVVCSVLDTIGVQGIGEFQMR